MMSDHSIPEEKGASPDQTSDALSPPSEPAPGLIAFFLDNRHWWLLPMLLVIVAIFAFAFYVESGEPVIYTRF